jgi:hypothetical protein
MNTIKGFFKVDEVYIELPLPFITLLYDVPQCKNFVYASFPWSEILLALDTVLYLQLLRFFL